MTQISYEELQKNIEAANQQVETLTKKCDDLQNKNEVAIKEGEKLAKKCEEQKAIIADLKDRLRSDSKKFNAEKKLVKDEAGDSHIMNVDKFKWRGVEYDHETLSKNPEAVSDMVKHGVQFLKEA